MRCCNETIENGSAAKLDHNFHGWFGEQMRHQTPYFLYVLFYRIWNNHFCKINKFDKNALIKKNSILFNSLT